jgi:hypothetical protein
MISVEKYEKLLSSGLSLDHYYVLVSLYNKTKLPNYKRINGFVNLLTKKGLIVDGTLSAEAIDMVQEVTIPKLEAKENVDFRDWVGSVHVKCIEKLVELTGKKQVNGIIKGKKWPFMCSNLMDFSKNLYKVITIYKVTDYDLMEKCLIRHIESCHQADHWFPSVYYYIFKDNKSQLVSDMESYDEEDSVSLTKSAGETFL